MLRVLLYYSFLHKYQISNYVNVWLFPEDSEKSKCHSVVSDSLLPHGPGTSVCGILQARILEWVAFPSPEHLPDPELQPGSPVLQTDCLLSKPAGKPLPENRLLTKIQNWKPWHRISFTYICWDIYTVAFDTTLLLKQIFYRNAQMETNSRGLD